MKQTTSTLLLLTAAFHFGTAFVYAEDAKTTPPKEEGALPWSLPAEEADAKKKEAADDAAAEFSLAGDEATAEGDASSDDDVFQVLPQFTVSSEKDAGYYSAHSLGGTRTSALIKDTPMTIEVINTELMEDLNLTGIDDLASVLSNVSVQEDASFNNRSLIFRGLKTADQMYEFMGRELQQDWYNYTRGEVIRGSNSLVYGQAAPGGKLNFIAKRPQFNKDSYRVGFQYGQYDNYRGDFDANVVINDKVAVRVMGVHKERDGAQTYFRDEFSGLTFTVTYRISEKTEVHAHIEYVDEVRRWHASPVNRDQTAIWGGTGSLRDGPATAEFYKYMPRKLKDAYINFNDGTNPNVPDFFTSDADIKRFYETLDVGINNHGEFVGPDYVREKDGWYLLADLTHQFSDNLSWKFAVNQEISDFYDRVRNGAGNIRLTHNFTDPVSGGNPIYYTTQANGTGTTVEQALAGASFDTDWRERIETDDSTSVRSTFSYSTNIGNSKQQFLFGQDFDRRETTRLDRNRYFKNTTTNNGVLVHDGGPQPPLAITQFWTYRDRPNSGGEIINWDAYNQVPGGGGNPFWDRIRYQPTFSIYGDASDAPGINDGDFGKFLDRNYVETTVDVYALWLANQGTYFNGRLNTLLGVRYDTIKTKSTVDKIAIDGYGTGEEVTYTVEKFSPTIGFHYWLNDNVAFFANYSHSIEAPTGFQRDIDGDLVPPEVGKGYEGGFKFEFLDGKVNGSLIAFSTTKEAQNGYPGNNVLQEIYPRPDCNYYEPNNADIANMTGECNGGFNPPGFFLSDTEIEVRGLELSVFYNPTPEWSISFNYGYLETEKKYFALEREIGDKFEGETPHTANLQVRYSFKKGPIKGAFIGGSLAYSSSGLYDTLYLPNSTDPDNPIRTEVWLDDRLLVNGFVGYGGKWGEGRNARFYRIQLNVSNIFNDRSLYASGNGNANSRFTNARAWTLSGSLTF